MFTWDVRLEEGGQVSAPPDSRIFPRFMSPTTFARLPRIDQVSRWGVAIVGIPFDIGTSYRLRARFGPIGIRQESRTLRNWHPGLQGWPFTSQQVVDAGDTACNTSTMPSPQSRRARQNSPQAEHGSWLWAAITPSPCLSDGRRVASTVKLRWCTSTHTSTPMDTYMGAGVTYGSGLRRAEEERLFDRNRSMHVGIERSTGSGLQATSNGSSSAWATHRPTYLSIDGRRARPGLRTGDRNP